MTRGPESSAHAKIHILHLPHIRPNRASWDHISLSSKALLACLAETGARGAERLLTEEYRPQQPTQIDLCLAQPCRPEKRQENLRIKHKQEKHFCFCSK